MQSCLPAWYHPFIFGHNRDRGAHRAAGEVHASPSVIAVGLNRSSEATTHPLALQSMDWLEYSSTPSASSRTRARNVQLKVARDGPPLGCAIDVWRCHTICPVVASNTW